MSGLIKTDTGMYREVFPEEILEAGDADLVGMNTFYPIPPDAVGQPSHKLYPCGIIGMKTVRVRRVNVEEKSKEEWISFNDPLPFKAFVLRVDLKEEKILVRKAP